MRVYVAHRQSFRYDQRLFTECAFPRKRRKVTRSICLCRQVTGLEAFGFFETDMLLGRIFHFLKSRKDKFTLICAIDFLNVFEGPRNETVSRVKNNRYNRLVCLVPCALRLYQVSRRFSCY